MCGISGILNINRSAVDTAVLQRMTDVLVHRGPDGQGVWTHDDAHIGFGHRRLSIIDLSEAGSQPMQYMGRYTITYNGEIYNYIELREALQKMGYAFKSNSDTEVILAAFDAWKEDCVAQFDGMFAFAIWDESLQSLFCARDRFGEKPLYYHFEKHNHFIFGSEIKALFAAGIQPEVNANMLYLYLAHDVVENPNVKSETFYKGIKKLEASHTLKIDAAGRLTKKRYWRIDAKHIDAGLSFEDACERFRQLFFESVKRRLRADVPVGSSLSGGLDSSAVVLTAAELMKERKQEQNVFSARFDDPSCDEGRYMEMVTKGRKIRSHQTWPDEHKLIDAIDKVFYHQEEPFGTASIFVQWEVMKLARSEGVTVLLDGQGADETMAGYLHYFGPFLREKFLEHPSTFKEERRAFEQLHGRRFKKNLQFKLEARYPHLLRRMGRMTRSFSTPGYDTGLNQDFVRSIPSDQLPFMPSANRLNKTLKYHCEHYGLEKLLRFSDRNAMAFSREVRLPFLSHELVEFLFTLPSTYKIHHGWTKRILRASMSSILPREIAWRVDKLGFMPPQGDWMQAPVMQEKIHEARRVLKQAQIVDSFYDVHDWRYLMAGNLFQERFQPAS